MSEKKYRVAVIGRTGKGNYGHSLDTVWLKRKDCEIVAVADDDETGRQKAQARLGAQSAYADYRTMLQKEKPQIVSVAERWLERHQELVIACAEHGCHIFLEKPIARNLAEADAMVAACQKHHVKCAIAHQTRYSPVVAQARKLIENGIIGDILEMRGHGKEDRRGGGEDMMVLGTHTFDLMRYFAADPQWCFARIYQGNCLATPRDVKPAGESIGPVVGDHINANYGFPGSIAASFITHQAKHGASARWWLEILGNKGHLQIGFGPLPFCYVHPDPSWISGHGKIKWQRITSNGLDQPETIKTADIDNGNIWIVNDLIDCIENDKEPLGSITDGRAALEMILAPYESHRWQKPVDFPVKNRKHPLSGW